MDRPTEAITKAKEDLRGLWQEGISDSELWDLVVYIEHLEAERDTARQQLAAATAENERLRPIVEALAAPPRMFSNQPGYVELLEGVLVHKARAALAATPEEEEAQP